MTLKTRPLYGPQDTVSGRQREATRRVKKMSGGWTNKKENKNGHVIKIQNFDVNHARKDKIERYLNVI